MRHFPGEEIHEFLVVKAHADDGFHLVFHELLDFRVVVAFVLAAEDEHRWGGHALEGIPCGIDVGGLGVVDVAHAVDGGYVFQAVFHGLEVFERLADAVFLDMERGGGDAGSHGVVEVVEAGEGEAVARDFPHLAGSGEMNDAVLNPGGAALFAVDGKGELHGFALHVLDLLADDGVVLPIDEVVVFGLVLEDAEFGGHVVLHLVVVAVEVVGGDVHDHGDVCLELIHVFKLEAGELDDVGGMGVFRHLERKALADVSGEAHVDSRLAEDMVGQEGSGGLAVGSGDADHARVGESGCELDLGEHGYPLLGDFLHHGGVRGYAGAFDHDGSVEDFIFGMTALLIGD